MRYYETEPLARTWLPWLATSLQPLCTLLQAWWRVCGVGVQVTAARDASLLGITYGCPGGLARGRAAAPRAPPHARPTAARLACLCRSGATVLHHLCRKRDVQLYWQSGNIGTVALDNTWRRTSYFGETTARNAHTRTCKPRGQSVWLAVQSCCALPGCTMALTANMLAADLGARPGCFQYAVTCCLSKHFDEEAAMRRVANLPDSVKDLMDQEALELLQEEHEELTQMQREAYRSSRVSAPERAPSPTRRLEGRFDNLPRIRDSQLPSNSKWSEKSRKHKPKPARMSPPKRKGSPQGSRRKSLFLDAEGGFTVPADETPPLDSERSDLPVVLELSLRAVKDGKPLTATRMGAADALIPCLRCFAPPPTEPNAEDSDVVDIARFHQILAKQTDDTIVVVLEPEKEDSEQIAAQESGQAAEQEYRRASSRGAQQPFEGFAQLWQNVQALFAQDSAQETAATSSAGPKAKSSGSQHVESAVASIDATPSGVRVRLSPSPLPHEGQALPVPAALPAPTSSKSPSKAPSPVALKIQPGVSGVRVRLDESTLAQKAAAAAAVKASPAKPVTSPVAFKIEPGASGVKVRLAPPPDLPTDVSASAAGSTSNADDARRTHNIDEHVASGAERDGSPLQQWLRDASSGSGVAGLRDSVQGAVDSARHQLSAASSALQDGLRTLSPDAEAERQQGIERATRIWKQLDANGDGYVDRDELKGHLIHTVQLDERMAERVFNSLDVDHNGQIELNEWLRIYGPLAANEANAK